jgi:hypothetical protein
MVTTLHVDTALSFDEMANLVSAITGSPSKYGTVRPSWGRVGVGDDLRSTETATGHPDDFLNWP